VAEPSAAPRRLQLLLIWGGGAPDVHVSLVAGGGYGPTPTVEEVGGTTPERAGEGVAAVDEASRSGAAVTTPPKIIPYYRLNHFIWSLSDNKESSR
jgi:hypothetical protein